MLEKSRRQLAKELLASISNCLSLMRCVPMGAITALEAAHTQILRIAAAPISSVVFSPAADKSGHGRVRTAIVRGRNKTPSSSSSLSPAAAASTSLVTSPRKAPAQRGVNRGATKAVAAVAVKATGTSSVAGTGATSATSSSGAVPGAAEPSAAIEDGRHDYCLKLVKSALEHMRKAAIDASTLHSRSRPTGMLAATTIRSILARPKSERGRYSASTRESLEMWARIIEALDSSPSGFRGLLTQGDSV